MTSSAPPRNVLVRPARHAAHDELWVDPDGDDGRGDGSEARPWRSVQHAVLAAAPGATIHLRSGTYREQVTIARAAGARPIVLRSDPAGAPAVLAGSIVLTGAASGWRIAGLALRADGRGRPRLAVEEGAHDLVLEDNDLVGGQIVVAGGRQLEVGENRIADAPGAAVEIGGAVRDFDVRRNRVIGGRVGVAVAGAAGVVGENHVEGVRGAGLALVGAAHVLVERNLVTGAAVGLRLGGQGLWARDNLIAHAHGPALLVDDGAGGGAGVADVTVSSCVLYRRADGDAEAATVVLAAGARRVELVGNVIVSHAGWHLEAGAELDAVLDHNLYWPNRELGWRGTRYPGTTSRIGVLAYSAASGQDRHSRLADPRFLSPEPRLPGDFQRLSDSPPCTRGAAGWRPPWIPGGAEGLAAFGRFAPEA